MSTIPTARSAFASDPLPRRPRLPARTLVAAPGKKLGQHVSGAARNDGGIKWSIGRKRGLGL